MMECGSTSPGLCDRHGVVKRLSLYDLCRRDRRLFGR